MEFSECLARERKAQGMSQEDLAGRIQVSRQAVSKWETGDAMPDLPKLLALAEVLALPLDVLCGREAAPEAAAPEKVVPEAALPETGAPASPAGRRGARLLPALCGFLAACLLCGGLWAWSRRDVAPAETAVASALPDAFTVSGVGFYGHDGYVNYRFVPSAAGEGITYQIVFTGSDGSSAVFDAENVGGVCAGSAAADPYDDLLVTVTATDGISSRSVPVARGLSFSDGSASWTSLEETP